MKPLLFVLPLVFVVAVSGCTGSGGTTPSPTTPPATSPPAAAGVTGLSIALTHGGGYAPNAFTVKKGDTVRFLATSDPVSHNHGITIDAFNVNAAVTVGSGGTPQAIEFVADQAGSFQMYCKTCEAGPLGPHPWMTGTLTVTE